MRNRSNRGFTLIELLIVIAIIGILAAVLIPNLLNARARAYDSGAQTCANSLQTAQEIYWLDWDTYAVNYDALSGAVEVAVACTSIIDANANNVVTSVGDVDGWEGEVTDLRGTQTYEVTQNSLDGSPQD